MNLELYEIQIQLHKGVGLIWQIEVKNRIWKGLMPKPKVRILLSPEGCIVCVQCIVWHKGYWTLESIKIWVLGFAFYNKYTFESPIALKTMVGSIQLFERKKRLCEQQSNKQQGSKIFFATPVFSALDATQFTIAMDG